MCELPTCYQVTLPILWSDAIGWTVAIWVVLLVFALYRYIRNLAV